MESIKNDKINLIEWLSNWYIQNCNDDWEHDYGISIETLDNPGWALTIETEDTTTYLPDTTRTQVENSPTDWFEYKIEEGKFIGFGDPTKLNFLINIFKIEIEKLL